LINKPAPSGSATADLVALSLNRRCVGPDLIADIGIVETWVNGIRVWTDGVLSK
jgi:hypothetical protein